MISLFCSSTHTFAANSKCQHSEATGRELSVRVYNAEKYRHVSSAYTESLIELKYRKDDIPIPCDIENWAISIQVKGAEEFLATIKSKLNQKTFTIDQNKKIKEL